MASQKLQLVRCWHPKVVFYSLSIAALQAASTHHIHLVFAAIKPTEDCQNISQATKISAISCHTDWNSSTVLVAHRLTSRYRTCAIFHIKCAAWQRWQIQWSIVHEVGMSESRYLSELLSDKHGGGEGGGLLRLPLGAIVIMMLAQIGVW